MIYLPRSKVLKSHSSCSIADALHVHTFHLVKEPRPENSKCSCLTCKIDTNLHLSCSIYIMPEHHEQPAPHYQFPSNQYRMRPQSWYWQNKTFSFSSCLILAAIICEVLEYSWHELVPTTEFFLSFLMHIYWEWICKSTGHRLLKQRIESTAPACDVSERRSAQAPLQLRQSVCLTSLNISVRW
jgi:hypothetical protein